MAHHRRGSQRVYIRSPHLRLQHPANHFPSESTERPRAQLRTARVFGRSLPRPAGSTNVAPLACAWGLAGPLRRTSAPGPPPPSQTCDPADAPITAPPPSPTRPPPGGFLPGVLLSCPPPGRSDGGGQRPAAGPLSPGLQIDVQAHPHLLSFPHLARQCAWRCMRSAPGHALRPGPWCVLFVLAEPLLCGSRNRCLSRTCENKISIVHFVDLTSSW